jgi:hypothetical protein
MQGGDTKAMGKATQNIHVPMRMQWHFNRFMDIEKQTKPRGGL